jgi:hypothetical protein
VTRNSFPIDYDFDVGKVTMLEQRNKSRPERIIEQGRFLSLLVTAAVVNDDLLGFLECAKHGHLFAAAHETDVVKAEIQQTTKLVAVTLESSTVVELKFAFAVLFYCQLTCSYDVIAIQIFSCEENHVGTAIGSCLDTGAEVLVEGAQTWRVAHGAAYSLN